MLLWYINAEGIEKVCVEQVSNGGWYILGKGITSDGSDLFRTKTAAMKRFVKNLGGRPTKVPYLAIIDGEAA